MRWMTRYFTLPILLSLSLTSVSIAVLYVLYKKDEEDIKSGKSHVEISKVYTTEYKVPKQFVPAVIGRGGSVIKDVQNKTGTQIHFEEENIECTDRICIIKGGYEAIHLAEEMIKSIIKNQPIIETYEMFIPQKAGGKIIGKGGEVIKQMQTSSGAKILIEHARNPHDSNSERKIIIKGTTKQITAALTQIQDKVREEQEARAKIEASSATRLPRGKLSPRNTLNTSEQVQSTESLPVSDGLMEVYVSAMENPSQFWVQIVGPGTTALDKLVSEMNTYYDNEENYEMHRLKNITIGQMVAARFSFNKQWYRAEIISTPENDQCEIFFVDYGDREVVNLDSVLELRTDFLRLRLQAVECSMANIKPPKNEWTSDECDFFADLTWLGEWKILLAKVKGYKERTFGCGSSRREGSPIPCVELYNKYENEEINVGQEMIKEGYAEPEETPSSTASSTLSLSTRSRHYDETGISPSPVSISPKPTFSPEMSANTSYKSDSAIETPNASFMSLETSSIPCRASSPSVEEIDLITPQKPVRPIEEIDLVTPAKDETERFIENEKEIKYRNGAGNQSGKPRIRMQIDKFSRVAPAGYESDLSDASDELMLG
ncbi:tudor and KH domain-containing protein homolog [Frieseomelitta varia]|uniref:tudor and KH domain-containing protein homolog n=1 Tax=Frieseomelitta varia TaxID=561572 RepID=UPI001CB680E8|nr:tudor and KH domain-containing protein homolog [Frieseomelitta varia]